MVPSTKNLGNWYLNLGKGLFVSFKFKGEDTCQGVAFMSSSNWNNSYFLITLARFLVDLIGLKDE